jgi:protein-disulfide isomerase
MNGNPGKLIIVLAMLVAGGALALSAYTVKNLGERTVAAQTAPAPQVAPAPAVDTEKIIEAATARAVEKTMAALDEKTRAIIKEELAKVAPAAPTPPPPPPAPPAPAPAAPKPPETKALGEAPKDLGPIPSGSFKTEMGAMPAVGPEDALVYVFIMSDFQCPVCKRAGEGLAPFLRENSPEVRWIFWNNPLDMHRRARAASKAAMAAFRQDKFWEYHDLLFKDQYAMADTDLENHARTLGLDLEKWKKDLADPALDFQFDANGKVATLLEARGTPSFVINGQKQVGWGSAAGIKSMVDREVADMKALVASGKSVQDARIERVKKNAENENEAQVFLDNMLGGKVPQD